MNFRSPEFDVFVEGLDAYMESKTLKANPHGPSTREGGLWEAGYIHAAYVVLESKETGRCSEREHIA